MARDPTPSEIHGFRVGEAGAPISNNVFWTPPTESAVDAYNRGYRDGKKAGYEETVRMIKKATHALKRGKPGA